MKCLLIFLILVGFGLPIIHAQYQGDVEFYHLPIIIESKQYSILAQSSVNEFTNVMYDNNAKSIILSISSPNDLMGIATITLNQQTMLDLLNNSDPNNVLLLINGEEQVYKTTTQDNIISWLFYIPSMSAEVELISSTEKFSKGDFKLENIPTIIPRIYPPLKQYHVGVHEQNIMCNEGLSLIHKYDGVPACVKSETVRELVHRGWTAKDDSALSKINTNCMTIKQSKQIASFFKTPTYLPDDYFYTCSRSGTPFESYIVYYNQEFPDNWQIHELVSDGAIFIYQVHERNLVGDKKFQTNGSPKQRIQETYDSVMEENPSLNPQLITINGMIAYAVDSCPDCGMQTANFADGVSIQTSTASTTKIKFIDENGVKYMLETTLPLSELIKIAESLE